MSIRFAGEFMHEAVARQLLFVYGTLRPEAGLPVSRWLRRIAEGLGPARTRGRLYDLGAYPGMVDAAEDHEWVHGHLYRLVNPDQALSQLDRYEGAVGVPHARLFERVLRAVVDQQGRTRTAGVYLYRQSVLNRSLIPGGEFLRAGDGLRWTRTVTRL